ncbi:MAG: type I polyketide synthase, partial [Acidobacteriota bacterium]
MAKYKDKDDIIESLDGSEIAIIGLDCRFPGAPDARTYWQNLKGGVESIRELTDDELEASGVSEAERNHESYVRAASVLDDVDRFDAGFFGYTPKEAEVMAPQHRLFLETAWRALEDAGYDADKYPDAVGVFGGARSNTYLFNIAGHRELVEAVGAFEIGLGNDLAFLTSAASYKLGLRGPAVSVHTACSTSLVAVHMACQSLLIDECRMAVAGGVAVNVPHHVGYHYTPGSIFSPDGHCRAFDADAKGTVFGSGVGLVVLKRLEDALADGDTVRAVIRGSAVNNDGDRKASFTAPGVTGQEDVILDALAAAGLSAADISYVEAHGTGTALGDPIEVRALTKAFQDDVDGVGVCGLGSVKTNFGHLDAAAGIASLIKMVLALEHKELPATLHYQSPNPNIDFAGSPFYVNAELRPWETELLPRRAGVSSFGIGGANAHLIVEEAPALAPSPAPRTAALLPISAKSEHSLDGASDALGSFVAGSGDLDLADAAYTLQVGRKAFKHRRFVVASSSAGAAAALSGEAGERADGYVEDGYCEVGHRPVVFGFSGQGSQYAGMAADLYRSEAVFRETVDACAEILLEQSGEDFRPSLFADAVAGEEVDPRTDRTQRNLFVVEVALAALWRSWGVEPKSMIGHSIGEVAPATKLSIPASGPATTVSCGPFTTATPRPSVWSSISTASTSASGAEIATMAPDGWACIRRPRAVT